jgi:hypothetical protein
MARLTEFVIRDRDLHRTVTFAQLYKRGADPLPYGEAAAKAFLLVCLDSPAARIARTTEPEFPRTDDVAPCDRMASRRSVIRSAGASASLGDR